MHVADGEAELARDWAVPDVLFPSPPILPPSVQWLMEGSRSAAQARKARKLAAAQVSDLHVAQSR